MKNQLRGGATLLVSYLFAAACSAAPPSEEVNGGDEGDDTQPSGGNAGTAGSGSAGTPANGGAPSGGSTSVGGVVGTGGGSGTVSTGGNVGTGGVATGGVGAMGGTNAGGAGGTVGNGGTGVGNGGTGVGGRGGAAGAPGGRGGGAGTMGKGGASGGTAGSGTGGTTGSSCSTWPTANGSQSVSATIQVSGTYDGTMKRFVGSGPLGTSGQQEGQGPLFELANGATLKNVVIGNPAADGVHCTGDCTLDNVWWEDVGEDAATFRGTSSSQKMTVRCSGARGATDKVFQHNGSGTLTIQNFTAENFNKLYRSCGNCRSQYARHVIVEDLTARMGQTLVGINTNYGDSADFHRITLFGNMTVCERYTGNNTGAEPIRTGQGSDSMYCRYMSSDITQR